MNCPNCGTENSPNSKFCTSCGGALQETTSIDQSQPDEKETAVSKIVYAGFWRRVVALLIDSLILGVAGAIIGGIVGFIVGFAMGASGSDLDTIEFVTGLLGGVLGLVLQWLYFTLFESSVKQATVGKMAIGIIVTDLNGNRISIGKANGRFWGKLVSIVTLGIGFIMAGFTERKQAIHDLMAGSLVVKK